MNMRGLILFTRQLHVISRSGTSIIKPASPTPENFKVYHLPLHDRMMPNIYIPAIFFYADINKAADHKSTVSNLLKNSLSETLTKYYPYAGRLRPSGSSVDCNDEGVHFVEARIGCKLAHVLEKDPAKEDEQGLGHLFPPLAIWDKLSNEKCSSLVLVQLNHFICGGIAIAVGFSHRIGDALTLLSFVAYWAGLSRHSFDHQKLLHVCPYIVSDHEQSHDNDSNTFNVSFPEKHWITKNVVFHNSNIARLKADVEIRHKLQGKDEPNYTRNELVTALLYRCVVAAAATSNGGAYIKSVLCQTVNIRPLLDPPLPQTSVGSFINYNNIATGTENETELHNLVERIREGKLQLRRNKGMDEIIAARPFEEFEKMNRIYLVSSICNFPLYKIDFGWGRPVKATIVDMPVVNSIILMDTPSGDGIEAIVGLEEKEMENFQAHRDLLSYISF